MSNFDKMIKLIEEKDIKGMEEWLHPDFLFVVDLSLIHISEPTRQP